MSDNQTERTVLYNQTFPMLPLIVVYERLQWDAILGRNVWAHPSYVCDAFQAVAYANDDKQ